MSVIDRETLLRNFERQIDAESAALFVGAGMSRAAGFVDWKNLMREVAEELHLDVEKETDLIALAQFHHNQRRNRSAINQRLVEEFSRDAAPTENHSIIAQLPISVVWTTNYDHLLENAYGEMHRRIDIKRRDVDFAVSKPRTDVTICKMHGDVDMPDEAVLTKEDYATFEQRRPLFSVHLSGQLVSRSFLFLGYSFSDPNVDYILTRIRAYLRDNKREHYCVMRDVARVDCEDEAEYHYRKRQLELRIEDLQNYGIQTHLVQQYSEVTEILRELRRRAVRRNVFVSGSAHDFAPLGQTRLESLARHLGAELIRHNCNLISGLGLGIGGAVAIGVLEELYRSPAPQLAERAVFRPFPQVAPSQGDLSDIWERYRQEMLASAGVAIFIAGNKLAQDSGEVVLANGSIREFQIAVARGAYPIPIGATGHVAEQLYGEVLSNMSKYYGKHAKKVEPCLRTLADAEAGEGEWFSAIFAIIKEITRS